MAKLSLWLPPFSPDYSGAVATLFDLSTVTAMHDAAGCTGNYTGYDEPRWYGSHSGIFCSGLREIDAVLGDDDKLIKKMIKAAKDIKPDVLALIGSPVPMVIGADLEGIAVELENTTGIPSFGFNTTGTAYYDHGAYMVAKALFDKFVIKKEAEEKRVNILGALPMDFGGRNDIENLKNFLSSNGYKTGISFAVNYTLDELKEMGRASINIAVSRFGYRTAVYMEHKYNIPYICGFPAGEKASEEWLTALEEIEKTGVSKILKEISEDNNSENILIIGEQVMSNSIRIALNKEFGKTSVKVASLYGSEKSLELDGDLDLKDEKSIKSAVNSPEYDVIIADPFLKSLLNKDTDKRFISFSQYAVSSKLGKNYSTDIQGAEFNKWLKGEKI